MSFLHAYPQHLDVCVCVEAEDAPLAGHLELATTHTAAVHAFSSINTGNGRDSGIAAYGDSTFDHGYARSRSHTGEEGGAYRAYPARWWVVFLFSLLSACQCCVWLTFGPIAGPASRFYGLSNATVALLSAYGSLAMLASLPLVTWMLDHQGIRKTFLLTGAVPFVVATAIRCAATGPGQVWALHVGHILNGAVASVVLAAPAKVSQIWFSHDERVLATAIITLANAAGAVFGFVAIPWQTETWGVYSMLVQWAVIATIPLALGIAYLPERPPTPPSRSAQTKPEPWLDGMCQLARNRDFLLLCIASGVPNGFLAALGSVYGIVLSPPPWNLTDAVNVGKNINVLYQSTGWIGTWATVAGVIGGFAIGRAADRVKAFKPMLLGLMTITTICFTWFGLTVFQYMPGNVASLVASLICASMACATTLPLFIELACEVAFPISPASIDGVIQAAYSLSLVIFQAIGMASNVLNDHPALMCWLMPGSCVVSLLALALVRGEHKRLKLDSDHAYMVLGSGDEHPKGDRTSSAFSAPPF